MGVFKNISGRLLVGLWRYFPLRKTGAREQSGIVFATAGALPEGELTH
jgi:hypothetical protein